MALGDVIARLSVSLGLETAAFEKGSRRAVQQTETLGKKMGKIAGAIGTAFVASIGVDTVRAWADATKGALEFAGSLGETAQQIGATTDELQEYRYVASQVGIEQEVMDKGLAKLSVTLGNLGAGVGSTAEKLEKFGLSQAEIARLSTLTAGEALPFLAGKYEALVSPTEKAAFAAAFFGSKMGGNFIPLLNEGAAGLQKMRDAAHDLGIVISETAIQNADKNADLITTYEKIADAQRNAALTIPDNVKAYVEYQKTLTNLQIGFYKAIGSLTEFNDWTKTLDQSLRDFGKNTGIQDFFKNFNAVVSDWARTTHDAIVAIPEWISGMVRSISATMNGALGAVWDNAIAKVNTVKRAFFNLYDAVVGHSYIPDMVDEIGANMARLDALMVKPAEKATAATARKFQELRDLLDRLFPESGKATQFNADEAAILGSGLSQAAKDEALARLSREYVSGSPFGGGGMGKPDFGDAGPLVQGMGATEDAIQRLTDKAKIGTVQIAKSFGDMATATLQSLQSLTSAIKGGGFLDILSAAVNVGLQLASSGAFGAGAAKWVNSPPKYATGTNFHPGGLALVGERGPELVSMPRGSKVTPNNKMGGTTIINMNGVLTNDEFWGVIQGRDMAAARAGAQGGMAQMAYRNSRRVG